MKNVEKKIFVKKKLNEESKKELTRSFEDPQHYLESTPNMLMSKQRKGGVVFKNKKPVPYTYVGPSNLFETALPTHRKDIGTVAYNNKDFITRSTSTSFLPMISMISPNPVKKFEDKKVNQIDFVDDQALMDYMNNFRKIENLEKKHLNDFLNEMPSEVKHKLFQQEHCLDKKSKNDEEFKKILKKISEKTKKPENFLLANNSSNFRLKNELLNLMENKIQSSEIFANDNCWTISLRKPKDFKGSRHALVNIGSPSHPIWYNMKETNPKFIEIIRSNETDETNFQTFTKNKYFMEKYNNKVVNLENLKTKKFLNVIGSNLLKEEINFVKNLKGKRKVLFRKIDEEIINEDVLMKDY